MCVILMLLLFLQRFFSAGIFLWLFVLLLLQTLRMYEFSVCLQIVPFFKTRVYFEYARLATYSFMALRNARDSLCAAAFLFGSGLYSESVTSSNAASIARDDDIVIHSPLKHNKLSHSNFAAFPGR